MSSLSIESGFGKEIEKQLTKKGHNIKYKKVSLRLPSTMLRMAFTMVHQKLEGWSSRWILNH